MKKLFISFINVGRRVCIDGVKHSSSALKKLYYWHLKIALNIPIRLDYKLPQFHSELDFRGNLQTRCVDYFCFVFRVYVIRYCHRQVIGRPHFIVIHLPECMWPFSRNVILLFIHDYTLTPGCSSSRIPWRCTQRQAVVSLPLPQLSGRWLGRYNHSHHSKSQQIPQGLSILPYVHVIFRETRTVTRWMLNIGFSRPSLIPNLLTLY